MGIWSWLQEVAILIIVYKITTAESDLLESFRPKDDNPPELNEFLTNVLDHRNDFLFVKEVARKYQKMKKDISDMDLYETLDNSLDYYNNYPNSYKIENKRNVHHYNTNRKFRNPGFLLPNMQHKKYHRINRRRIKKHALERELFPEVIMLKEHDDTVQKRMPAPIVMDSIEESGPEKHIPSEIFIQDQGEKLQKRTPEDITVVSEGEKGKINVGGAIEKKEIKQPLLTGSIKKKKQAMDWNSEVHRTYKPNQKKRIDDMRNNKQGDFYYVDLQDAAEKEKERYNDKRRYGWSPHNQGFYYRPNERIYGRPIMRGRPYDYPQYEIEPHHSINDEVAFEKALSYEIDPRHQEDYSSFNNPSGNSLYSVDEGRPDTLQPLYTQSKMQGVGRYDYPPQEAEAVTNERFFIDNDNSMKKIETTNTESTTSSGTTTKSGDNVGEKKTIKHIGSGFIEITKSRRENDEEAPLSKKSLSLLNNAEAANREENQVSDETHEKNKHGSSISFKHSLHPLRVKDTSKDENDDTQEYVEDQDRKKRSLEENKDKKMHFKSRKLQFNDDYMTNFYDQNDDYDQAPPRPRRDFLDALGMKNEEDYTEDNPYQNEMNVNNTDVHNDTCIQSSTTSHPTTAKKTTSHQKEDVTSIQKILEEPKETTPGNCQTNKTPEKRPKKSPEIDDYDDMVETNEIRMLRETNKDVESKIMKNKDRIYNANEDYKAKNFNNNVQRQERAMSNQWPLEQNFKQNNLQENSFQNRHRINKKENNDCFEPKTSTEAPTENCTETTVATTTESVSNYEQIANQMDIENEKLAQVVNGHLASKIVSTVFEEMRKKSSLKTKFYSGLSRKHVNYAGTIDFDIFKTNETEDVDEARLLLDKITKVLNKLVLNQVRRKLCQRLPDELKDYLDILLNVKNTLMDNANPVPNPQQGDFLFTYQDKNEPPFNLKKLQGTLVELEGLLLSYRNMNEDCQNRAAPVKDYIEKHVKMLKQIVTCPTHNCDSKLGEIKRDTPSALHHVLVEKQLESIGLGRRNDFVPNFDVNQIVRNKMHNWKINKKRDVQKNNNNYKSPQYRKLQLAAERIREKRENEKKIAELFGSNEKRSVKNFDVDYEEPAVYSLV